MMKNIGFTAADLVSALQISKWEAKGLLSGDLEFDDGEMAQLAEWKGISVAEVEEYFEMSEC